MLSRSVAIPVSLANGPLVTGAAAHRRAGAVGHRNLLLTGLTRHLGGA